MTPDASDREPWVATRPACAKAPGLSTDAPAPAEPTGSADSVATAAEVAIASKTYCFAGAEALWRRLGSGRGRPYAIAKSAVGLWSGC